MSARLASKQQGAIPLFLVVLICIFLIGLVIYLSRNYSPPKPASGTKPVSSQTPIPPTSAPQKLSLKKICLSEAKSVPKPPFEYQLEDGPVGTLPPSYKKERFTDAKNIYSCYTSFLFNRIMEKAYADMGLAYYTVTKTGNKWVKPETVKSFEMATYNKLTESFKKDGWESKSQYGEKREGYGTPIMLLTKQKDGRKYFIDIGYSGLTGINFSYIITVVEK